MGMKLLPKSKIHEAKAAAKKQQIDQGVQLAKRVDTVRETLSEEENNLERFRRESIARIHEETRIAGEERDTAIKERDAARSARDIALRPLTEEKKLLAQEKQEIAGTRLVADALLASAQKEDLEVRQKNKDASDTLKRIALQEHAAREALIAADEAEKKAQNALFVAEEIHKNATLLAEKMDTELLHRDEAMAMKENGLILREEHLKAGEAELEKGWKLLEDRKATFERAITRPKK